MLIESKQKNLLEQSKRFFLLYKYLKIARNMKMAPARTKICQITW